jgi:hypothetical protein
MARLIADSSTDAQARRPVTDHDRRGRRWRCPPLWAVMLVAAALPKGPDSDGELMQELAAFQMMRGAIAGYHVNAEAHTLDIKINPTTTLPTGEAGVTGRKTCALGTHNLGTKLTHPWTIRVFIDFDAAQVFVCEIAPTPARSSLTPRIPSVVPAANHRATVRCCSRT